MEQNSLAEIKLLLLRFFRDPTRVDRWLETANPHLGDQTPNEMIARGQIARLLRWVKLHIN
jgi:hypothetical protein